MFKNIQWLFFDVGSTIVDEHIAYEHRMKDIDYTVKHLTEICNIL